MPHQSRGRGQPSGEMNTFVTLCDLARGLTASRAGMLCIKLVVTLETQAQMSESSKTGEYPLSIASGLGYSTDAHRYIRKTSLLLFLTGPRRAHRAQRRCRSTHDDSAPQTTSGTAPKQKPTPQQGHRVRRVRACRDRRRRTGNGGREATVRGGNQRERGGTLVLSGRHPCQVNQR